MKAYLIEWNSQEAVNEMFQGIFAKETDERKKRSTEKVLSSSCAGDNTWPARLDRLSVCQHYTALIQRQHGPSIGGTTIG